jgi:hypothetical protein
MEEESDIQIPSPYLEDLSELNKNDPRDYHLLNKGERCDSIFHIWPRDEGMELPLTTQEDIDPGLPTWMPNFPRRLRLDLPKLAGFSACKDTR